jgi:hypothetical protein
MDADLYKPFKIVFKVLEKLGLWRKSDQTYRSFVSCCAFQFTLICIYVTAMMIYGFKAENLIDFVDSFSVGIATFTMALKTINFFIRIRGFGKFLENLNSLLDFSADPRFADRVHIRKEVNFAFKVYKIFFVSGMTTCSSSVLVPFFAHQLPFKAWFPFTTEYGTIGFWIASTYLVVHSFCIAAIDVALDILPVIFMSFAVGLLNELAARLSEIGKIDARTEFDGPGNMNKYLRERIKNYKTRKELVKCIEMHQKIKEFVMEIERNFAASMLIQGIMSSVILCMSAFTLSTVSKI